MKKLVFISLLLILSFTLVGCKKSSGSDENVVYVTLYPVEFLVEEIAGDTVTVKTVPGTSSHGQSVDWSAKEIIDMSDSDLLFYINGGADSYIPSKKDVFKGGNVDLIDLSTYIEYNMLCLTHDHEHEEEETVENEVCDENSLSPDPHFWLDPVRMKTAAEIVKSKLITAFPDNQELYENNYSVLDASLEQLNTKFLEITDGATKPIMTTVRLFSYWEERYGIEILSITNDVHSSENNPAELIELVNEAVEHDIMYILFEYNANSPAGDQVLEELKETRPTTEKLELHGLGKLSTDDIENGENYLSLMLQNIEVLKNALK